MNTSTIDAQAVANGGGRNEQHSMKSNLYKNGYCLVLEVAGEKTRIAPYANVRPAHSSIWADNTGKKVSPAIWVNSTELEVSSEQLTAKKIEAIKKTSLALVK